MEFSFEVEQADKNDHCCNESEELVKCEIHQVHSRYPTIPALTIAPNSAFCTGVVAGKPT
jgi:hypothetical protein